MMECRFIGDVETEIKMSKSEYDGIIAQLEGKHCQEMDALRKQHALLRVKYDNLLKATKAIAYCLNFEKDS